jgi:acyl-coenzyme A thioesterase PaaI-like protein
MKLTAESVSAAVQEIWPEGDCVCLELSRTHAVASLGVDNVNLRPGGYIPGPTQFAAADMCLWYLVFGALDRIVPMALTSELSIRFLRPSVGQKLYARASLDRAGRRAVVGTVRVWTDDNLDRPCATAQGTYMLPDA